MNLLNPLNFITQVVLKIAQHNLTSNITFLGHFSLGVFKLFHLTETQ